MHSEVQRSLGPYTCYLLTTAVLVYSNSHCLDSIYLLHANDCQKPSYGTVLTTSWSWAIGACRTCKSIAVLWHTFYNLGKTLVDFFESGWVVGICTFTRVFSNQRKIQETATPFWPSSIHLFRYFERRQTPAWPSGTVCIRLYLQ